MRELLAKGANIEALREPLRSLADYLMQDWPEMEEILALSISSRVPPGELAGTASAYMPPRAPRTVVSKSEMLTERPHLNFYRIEAPIFGAPILRAEGRELLPQKKLRSNLTMVPTTVYRCCRGVCSEDIIRALRESPSPAVPSSNFAYAAHA